MDGARFDQLTRHLATRRTRRNLLGGLVAGALGLAGLDAAGAATCRAPGRVCREHGNCCSGLCGAKDARGPRRCACQTPTDCPSPRKQCLAATCAGGICGITIAAGAACDDGDPCTVGDACDSAGVCRSGGLTDCASAGDACHDGICDPRTGGCVARPKPNGTTCNDGDPCTVGDACQAGVCSGTPKVCDDGLACTASACGPDGACIHSVTAGWCLIGGVCVAAGAREAGNPCRLCDPAQSQTGWSNAALGTPCDDATLCNGKEACDGAGACAPGVPVNCPDPLPCQEAGVCDPATGECSYALKTGTTCRDAAGDCDEPASCDGVNPTCPPNEIAVGRECDDGDSCTTGAVCQEDGSCAGTVIACADDGLACTESHCDPARGCVHDLRPGFCLIFGVCYAAGDVHPSGCFVCDPSVSTTAFTKLADGTPCNEANLCVQGATCQNGTCGGGTTTVCPQPTELCHDAVCDPENGTCNVILVGVGNLVRDRKGCSVCPGCLDGVCQLPLEPVACGLCQTCDPTSGTCLPAPEGTDCGSTCTERVTCTATGTCVGVPSDGCFNVDQCAATVCDPDTALCLETGDKNGQACGDDQCHLCDGGSCVPKECGVCEQCDPATGCTACSPCCGGICGQSTCGDLCCGPDQACCTTSRGRSVCLPKLQVCEGKCFPNPVTCCGPGPAGDPLTCPIDSTCCSTAPFFAPCCPPGQICGQFGCASV